MPDQVGLKNIIWLYAKINPHINKSRQWQLVYGVADNSSFKAISRHVNLLLNTVDKLISLGNKRLSKY